MKLLYLSYDGILEPLGQSQILSYLEKLSLSHEIYLVSFEKKQDLKNVDSYKLIKKKINNSNIRWYKLSYHKYPLLISTLFDIFCGLIVSTYIILSRRIFVIHARSYVPGFTALILKKITGIKYIFDIRGFWADEKLVSGSWDEKDFIFKFVKFIEKKIFLNADYIVSLTKSGKDIINKYLNFKKQISVIPTCVDLKKFYFKPNNSKKFRLGYVGTASGWYNFDLTLKFFKAMLTLDKNSNMIILNKGEHNYIKNKLKKFNIPKNKIILKSVSFSRMPYFINQMSFGVFFINPSFSKKASCPTKFAEFMSCGVPIITGPQIGDIDEIIEKEKIGLIIKKFTNYEIYKNLIKMKKIQNDIKIKFKCRNVANKYFSILDGIEKYNKIYEKIKNN